MAKRGPKPKVISKKMIDEALEEFKEGASIVEISALWGMSRETLYQYIDKESKYFRSEISDTIKSGLRLSQAWWEKKGRKNLENREFNYTGWYMNMKNRFGWKDKQDITSNGKTMVQTINVVDKETKDNLEKLE